MYVWGIHLSPKKWLKIVDTTMLMAIKRLQGLA